MMVHGEIPTGGLNIYHLGASFISPWAICLSLSLFLYYSNLSYTHLVGQIGGEFGGVRGRFSFLLCPRCHSLFPFSLLSVILLLFFPRD